MTSWHIFGLWLLLLKKELQFRVWPGFLLRPPLIRWSSSGDLPGLVSPPAINQRKGGCGQQLRTRSLHYWQRNHRSHYWSDQKNGRSLHWIARLFGLSFLWWRHGNKKTFKKTSIFLKGIFYRVRDLRRCCWKDSVLSIPRNPSWDFPSILHLM